MYLPEQLLVLQSSSPALLSEVLCSISGHQKRGQTVFTEKERDQKRNQGAFSNCKCTVACTEMHQPSIKIYIFILFCFTPYEKVSRVFWQGQNLAVSHFNVKQTVRSPSTSSKCPILRCILIPIFFKVIHWLFFSLKATSDLLPSPWRARFSYLSCVCLLSKQPPSTVSWPVYVCIPENGATHFLQESSYLN